MTCFERIPVLNVQSGDVIPISVHDYMFNVLCTLLILYMESLEFLVFVSKKLKFIVVCQPLQHSGCLHDHHINLHIAVVCIQKDYRYVT